MGYYFTSESVSEGHPDKVADQISDAVLDEMLRQDPESKVACETLVTTGLTVVAGEVKSNGYVDIQGTARRVIERIGYTKAEISVRQQVMWRAFSHPRTVAGYQPRCGTSERRRPGRRRPGHDVRLRLQGDS